MAPAPAPAPGFSVALSAEKLLLIQGHTAQLTATITRENGFDDAVTVDLKDLPAGVSAAPVLIGRGATSATVTVGGLPGVVDTSFNGGRQLTSVGEGEDYAFAVAVQPDGKVITVGRTSTNAGGYDGKIVAAGSASFPGDTGQDFAIARYRTDGTLDPAFGIAGKMSTSFGSFGANELAYAVVLQRFGDEQRIVAVGGEGSFIAARYTAMGLLDPNFGDGGKVHALFRSTIGSAESVTLTEDNKIVIAGHIGHEFALAQLNTDGQLDTGFGEEGKVTTPISMGNWDEATAVVRQADGKLLVGGWSYEGDSTAGNFVVLRYTAQGRADASFGLAGQVIAPVAPPGRSDAGRALALQPDDRVPTVRLIQAGEVTDGSYKFALQRYWL